MYKYRVFTIFGGALCVLSKYSTCKELWEYIISTTDAGVEFVYADQIQTTIHIRPSAIVAVDNLYGESPISWGEKNPIARKKAARVVIGRGQK